MYLCYSGMKDQEKQFTIIAGPCSVETEAQMMQVANGLKDKGVTYLRGGVWKPRTMPGSFEGLGSDALPMLKQAAEEADLKSITEVARASHVEEALKAEIDALWVGARTTANPFSVQELADALKGVDIPVFIKNPIHPDLQLWFGAIERLKKAGIQNITAIHRGFSGADDSVFRNPPRWDFVVELKTQYKDIPVLCDSSHITGKRDLVEAICQKAIDMDMDGLMVEVHPDPDNAWSDAAQQLSLDQFMEMRANLIFRDHVIRNPEVIEAMEQLRTNIDELDEQIIKHLAERMEIAGRIGNHKKEEGITILQLNRWKEVLQTRSFSARDKGLSEEFIKELISLIHQESIRIQNIVMNEKPVKENDENPASL